MIKTLKKQLMLSTLMLGIGLISTAQTSTGTQTFTAQGTSAEAVSLTINIPGDITVNEGKPIVSITISSVTSDFELNGLPLGNMVGCGDFYNYTLNIDSDEVLSGACDGDFTSQNLTNASEVTITSVDLGAIPIPIPGLMDYNLGIEVKLSVTYSECDANAGEDAVISPCMNEPIDLEAFLGNGAQPGGTWTGPEGDEITSGNITSASIPGQYNYTYSVVVDNDCADDATVTVDVQDCDYLSVTKEILEDVTVYPNPASEIVTIDGLPQNGSSTIEVMDLSGRMVTTMDVVNAISTTFDVSSLQNGLYIVRLTSENSEKVIRLIKQ